ncbi:MAG TPA: alpha/beta fold hydrolase, partial [Thermoanaerobaculia bacterium]|nr:alpha/beta fold hydrolase [Thermoanaerobaculia bacterium]
LGEIETQLAKHPAVREAVVVAREDEPGEKRLVAYVTNAGQSAGAEELRAYLLARLPQYMVPAAFVELESLPLTPNKKVDRRALPKPEAEAFVRREFVPPQGETEGALAEIWQQLLHVERVGRNDDFFELGGHSLSAVQLMARINARFRQMLPLAVLFQAPTIASFARLLAGDQKASFDILVPIQPEGDALPVFAIPGVGGNVLSLRPLRHALGDEQPLYALQAAGLDGVTAPAGSVEEAARTNIAAMKSVQPAGPYSLIGHSYGGAVAYEMARILLEQGEPVSSLVLLDSVAPAIFQQNPAPDEITELMEAGQAVADVYGETLTIDRQQFGGLPPGERLESLTRLLRERGLEIDSRQFAAFFNVYRANHDCYRKYVPGTLPRAISVTLYRATLGREERRSLAPDYGWNALLPSPIRTVDVEADHFTILDKVPLRAGTGARTGGGALEPSADIPDVVPTT